MNPTLAGFISFIRNVMGIGAGDLPDNSIYIPFAFNMAMNIVNVSLSAMPNFDPTQPTIYATAVYNFGGDVLVNVTQDTPPATFFADLRKSLGLSSFTAGVINSTSDEGTSEGLTVPKVFEELTIGNLQSLKTPWGRTYLSIAQSYGSLWGVT